MKYLPSIIKAKYLSDFIIELTFDDGTCKAVDFSLWLTGEVFKPLKKKEYFKKFFLDGSTVTWPNGADIAPETLYKATEVKNGHNRVIASRPD
jgi:hypothetical protein